METARSSTLLAAKSFVANPKVSLANLDLLTDAAENQMKRLRGLTVSKVVPKEDIEQADDKRLTLNYRNFRQSYWEGARADFNGEGIEDILVFTGGQAVGGTLGFSDYFFLTRTRPSGPVTMFRNPAP